MACVKLVSIWSPTASPAPKQARETQARTFVLNANRDIMWVIRLAQPVLPSAHPAQTRLHANPALISSIAWIPLITVHSAAQSWPTVLTAPAAPFAFNAIPVSPWPSKAVPLFSFRRLHPLRPIFVRMSRMQHNQLPPLQARLKLGQWFLRIKPSV